MLTRLALIFTVTKWRTLAAGVLLFYYRPRWVLSSAVMLWRAYLLPALHVTGLQRVLNLAGEHLAAALVWTTHTLLQTPLGQRLLAAVEWRIQQWVSQLHHFTERQVYHATALVLDNLRKSMKVSDHGRRGLHTANDQLALGGR
jgi:hypothetical protein